MRPGETLDDALARHQLTADETIARLRAHGPDHPAGNPGWRRGIADLMGLPAEIDTTDIEIEYEQENEALKPDPKRKTKETKA